jgi:hypothetical protein
MQPTIIASGYQQPGVLWLPLSGRVPVPVGFGREYIPLVHAEERLWGIGVGALHGRGVYPSSIDVMTLDT